MSDKHKDRTTKLHHPDLGECVCEYCAKLPWWTNPTPPVRDAGEVVADDREAARATHTEVDFIVRRGRAVTINGWHLTIEEARESAAQEKYPATLRIVKRTRTTAEEDVT